MRESPQTYSFTGLFSPNDILTLGNASLAGKLFLNDQTICLYTTDSLDLWKHPSLIAHTTWIMVKIDAYIILCSRVFFPLSGHLNIRIKVALKCLLSCLEIKMATYFKVYSHSVSNSKCCHCDDGLGVLWEEGCIFRVLVWLNTIHGLKPK